MTCKKTRSKQPEVIKVSIEAFTYGGCFTADLLGGVTWTADELVWRVMCWEAFAIGHHGFCSVRFFASHRSGMFCIQILFLPSWKWRMGPYEISFLYRVIFQLNDYAYYGRKGIPDQIQTFLCLQLKGSGKNTTNDVVIFFFWWGYFEEVTSHLDFLRENGK